MRCILSNTNSKTDFRAVLGVFCIFLYFFCNFAFAAETWTLDGVGKRITNLEASSDLDQKLKDDILVQYEQIRVFLKQQESTEEKRALLEQKIKTAEVTIEKINKQFSSGSGITNQAFQLPDNATLGRVEVTISQIDTRKKELSLRLKEQQVNFSQLQQEFPTLQGEILDDLNKIENINTELSVSASAEHADVLTEARQELLLVNKSLQEAEVSYSTLLVENERLLIKLAITEIELSEKTISSLEDQKQTLILRAQSLRRTKANQRLVYAAHLRDEIGALPPEVRILADENVELSRELEGLIQKEALVQLRLKKTQEDRDNVRAEFEATRLRVNAAGLSNAIGRMLRKRLTKLPSADSYRVTASERSDEISLYTDRQIDIGEQLIELSDLDGYAEGIFQSVQIDQDQTANPQLKSKTLETVSAKQQTLNELQKLFTVYVFALTAQDAAEIELVELSKEFVSYINEKLLWIKSVAAISLTDLIDIPVGLTVFVSSDRWAVAAIDLSQSFRQSPFPMSISIMFFLALILLRRHIKSEINELALASIKIRTDSFNHTIKVVIYTVLLAVAIPGIMYTVGWHLRRLPSTDEFTQAITKALIISASVLLLTDFFRQMCRKNGLASRHFRWPESTFLEIRKVLQWLVIKVSISTFVIAVTARFSQELLVPTLGRPVFVLLMISLVLICMRLFKQTSPLMMSQMEKYPQHWVTQLRILWFPLITLIPISLMVLSLLGYHHSALYISEHVLMTLWLLMGLLFVKELLLRSLYIDQRKRKFEESVKRRDEIQVQKLLEEQSDVTEQTSPPPIPDEPEVSYEQLSEQAKRLLRAGMLFSAIVGVWSIWVDLLPALGFLDSVKLPFTTTEIVDGVAKQAQVTLADIGIGLFVAAITFFAAKNLPGVLEITLLQHLPMDAGARYAFTTLSQYIIVAIGVVVAFSMIGAEWTSIQWLIAALSVGLGFGLQEIFANFISGLIILFERPVRVGDTVTVANLSGTVSKIHIRATTLTDWDHKEIIVPNKNFITERLINWTLSDPVTRVVIPIGIAYGSDTKLAYDIIIETASRSLLVLKEPELQLFFLGFGDSALNFELRVFVRELDDRLPVTHELHMSINEALKQNNIEIPFPQQDIHIRTIYEQQK